MGLGLDNQMIDYNVVKNAIQKETLLTMRHARIVYHYLDLGDSLNPKFFQNGIFHLNIHFAK
jgi:hypothetical protein